MYIQNDACVRERLRCITRFSFHPIDSMSVFFNSQTQRESNIRLQKYPSEFSSIWEVFHSPPPPRCLPFCAVSMLTTLLSPSFKKTTVLYIWARSHWSKSSHFSTPLFFLPFLLRLLLPHYFILLFHLLPSILRLFYFRKAECLYFACSVPSSITSRMEHDQWFENLLIINKFLDPSSRNQLHF